MTRTNTSAEACRLGLAPCPPRTGCTYHAPTRTAPLGASPRADADGWTWAAIVTGARRYGRLRLATASPLLPGEASAAVDPTSRAVYASACADELLRASAWSSTPAGAWTMGGAFLDLLDDGRAYRARLAQLADR